jgi:hypothetical protein
MAIVMSVIPDAISMWSRMRRVAPLAQVLSHSIIARKLVTELYIEHGLSTLVNIRDLLRNSMKLNWTWNRLSMDREFFLKNADPQHPYDWDRHPLVEQTLWQMRERDLVRVDQLGSVTVSLEVRTELNAVIEFLEQSGQALS